LAPSGPFALPVLVVGVAGIARHGKCNGLSKDPNAEDGGYLARQFHCGGKRDVSRGAVGIGQCGRTFIIV